MSEAPLRNAAGTDVPPSGTVTFLFTDIEGSTRLWEDHPDVMPEALAQHDAVLRNAVESAGGHVVKTSGDGLFAAFRRVDAALMSALAVQRALAAAEWGKTGPLLVRVGLHTGDAEFRAGDYHGQAVNRAARLMTAGHGGQVLVSEATASLVGEQLPEGAELIALGEHRLRDLGRSELLYQLSHPDLRQRFPPLRTLDAFPGNLPLQVSSFIGREREVARIVQALDDARAVTLTGVGGVGKTRLALQVAARLLPQFREGAWLVELAPIRDPDGVPGALAAVFGVTARAGMTLEQSLAEFMRTKQLLVVLDNCEHLLEAVAELVESLERECAGLVVLATSREGLAVDGERVVPVPSLPSPSPDAGPAAAGEADAVRLFVERARAVDPDFTLSVDNTATVVQLCRRLDGVPLAIELAAARVGAMSPAELVEGLERRFDTLAGGRRRAVQRHQTLRAAIDWSYELLSVDERRLLARLAVFAGGCTRKAAEKVCGTKPLDSNKVFGLLAALVAKSLVVAQRDGPETRLRLLETIREYGEERLAENGETEIMRAEHAEYFWQWALDRFDELYGPHQIEASRRLVAEHENLLAAVNYAIDTDNVDVALQMVYDAPIDQRFGYRLVLPIDAVLRLSDAADHPLYPVGLAAAAVNAVNCGDLAGSAAACEEALAAARHLGRDHDDRVDLLVSVAQGGRAIAIGAWGQGAAYFEEAMKIARLTLPPLFVANQLAHTAIAHTMAGNAGAAAPLADEGLDLARRAGAPISIVINLVALAGALADSDPPRARALLSESLQLRATHFEGDFDANAQGVLIAARMADWSLVLKLGPGAIQHLHWVGDRPFLAGILNIVARALASADPESAAVFQGAASRLVPGAARTPRPAPGGESFVTELRGQTTAILRDTLGEETLRRLRAEGEAMGDGHVLAYTLDAINRATE